MNGVLLPSGFALQRLARTHPRKSFRSGQPAVDEWRKANALQNQEKHLSVTKVLLDDAEMIAGYYTLATAQIDFSDLPAEVAKKLPRRLLPAAVLAWLGVSQQQQGQGLGKLLLAQALADCYVAGQTFAFVAVIIDCIDNSAKSFYQQFQFAELPGHPYRLFLSAGELTALMPVALIHFTSPPPSATLVCMAKPKPIPTSSKPAKAAAPAKKQREIKVVSENRKARHEYEILETLECGIMLAGSEVKSLRDGKLSLDESYARVKEGDLWLLGADIPEYPQATIFNHKPKRPRKLLVHKNEFRKFAQRAKEKGLTLVPLKVYFNERGVAKVLLGLCKGKKLHDKRETLKKSDAKRDMARAMRGRAGGRGS